MTAFLLSTALVALSEIGDKTQLLAFLLAARYRRPLPIIAGILAATLLNHTMAAAVGSWLQSLVAPPTLRWILGLSFIAMAVWMLVPDEADDEPAALTGIGLFGTTLVAFFAAEMGDKTQLATVALAARFGTMVPVIAGTTLGMMLADTPAVLLGERLAERVPGAWVRRSAAALFALVGVATIAFPAGWL